ncbi:MAG: hypothetical protein K0M45_11400 [Candidatus Paracaedibacteraceae bacterium]|nr:hypothetical protein [Candidatus Paracaedibacteraceae bacterium]
MPSWYGNWRAILLRFFRWIQRGIWVRLLEKAQIDADLEAVMIDGTIIRTRACSAGYGKNSQKE